MILAFLQIADNPQLRVEVQQPLFSDYYWSCGQPEYLKLTENGECPPADEPLGYTPMVLAEQMVSRAL